MTIDRSALEETINAIHGCAGMSLTLHIERLHQLAKAAQAHLDTLPAQKWGVNCGFGWVHFDHLTDAIYAVRVEAKAGRAVTIEFRVQS